MTRDIAHGRVVIDIDVDRAMAELEAAKGQIRKTLSDVDRMDAEASVSIDKKALRRDIAEIKAEIKALEADKIELDAVLHKEARRDLDRQIKKLKSDLADHQAVEILVKVDDAELKDLEKAEKKLAATRKRNAAEFESSMMREGRLHMEAIKRRDREMTQEGQLHLLARRRAVDTRKQAVEVEKLRASYAKLYAETQRAEKSALFGDPKAVNAHRRLLADLDLHREKITQLGGAYKDLEDSRTLRSFDTHESSKSVGNMIRSLASVRLQMGFFSATLRQAATGFTLLGPVIFGVAGQIAALVGVLGTGLAGALAVSTAGAIGFAGAALGVGLIIKPMIGDLMDAKKASDAYGDAVRKYGKDSTQAQTAQEKLNKTLGDIGPEAREGFKELGQMSDKWSKLTQGNRKPFFETMGKGIKLASSYLPMFARESNKTFKAASDAAEDWIGMFDAPEARVGLQNMLSNFRGAIPGLNAGFMSIGKTIGKIGSSASRWLKPLSEGFSDWADNMFNSLDKNGGLDGKIDRIVGHMRQIGQFAQSAGSMLATFFNAGANEGATLLQTLTSISDRWKAWMQTSAGQQGLADFFRQANQIGSQFVATLATIGVALFEFSTAFAPLSQGFVSVISGITQVVAALMSLEGARTVVTMIGGALAGAFVASKFMAAYQAITMLVSGLRALGTANAAASLASMTNPILALAAAAGAAAALIMTMGGSATSAEQSLQNLQSMADSTKESITSLNQINMDMISGSLSLASANLAVAEAQRNHNRAIQQYGKGSLEARRAALGVRQAQQYAAEAQDQYSASLDKQGNKAEAIFSRQNQLYLDQQGNVNSLRQSLEVLDRKRRASGATQRDQELYASKLREVMDAEQKLARMRVLADKANNAIFQSDLMRLRSQEKAVGVVKGLGEAWKEIKTITSGIDFRGQDAIAGIFKNAPKQASAVVRQVHAAVQKGLGSKANQILINPKLNDNQVLNQLRQLTSKVRGKALVEASVKTDKADRQIKQLGQGKTATINAKANTKQAQRDMSKLSGKQLVNRITIRANNNEAMSKLNAVQRYNLRRKLVNMGANDGAARAAIRIINSQKLTDKKLKFLAETAAAERGNQKVQGFKDKDLKLNASWEGAGDVAAANAAIASIPPSKTTTLTTVHKDVYQSSGRASGGFHSFASGGVKSPMPAQEKRYAASADRADRRQARPGIYKRPTLLVGEENRKEYVISTNDSYRGVNEGYLRAAANEFGYDLAPMEMAAGGKGKGYKPLKPMTGHKPKKGYGQAKRFPRYDYLSGKVSYWDDRGSNLETKRSLMLEAGETTGVPSIDSILQSHMNEKKALENLRDWIRSTISNMQKKTGLGKAFGSSDRERKWGNEVIKLKRKIRRKRGTRPKDAPDGWSQEKKKVRATAQRTWDKELQDLQDDLTKAQNKRDTARNKTRDLNSEMGRFKRELEQQMPGQFATLQNDIDRWKYIKDGKIDDPTKPTDSSGGSDSTPMGVQLGQLDAARYENFRQFGSNIAALGPGAVSGGVPGGPSGYAASGAAPSAYKSAAGGSAGAYAALSGQPAAARAAQAGAASAGGGKTITQNITIAEPPPDPHSFTRQLGWEAAAMLG